MKYNSRNFKTIKDLSFFCFNQITINKPLKNQIFYFILSGGTSPRTLFKMINKDLKNNSDWGQYYFLMSDERQVPINHQDSNLGTFIRLSGIPESQTVDINSMHRSESKFREIIPFDKIFEKDLIIKNAIIGMGEDGHFASIFPNDNDSLKAIKGSDRSYMCENKNITHSRITLSLKMIAKSEKIFLLVTSAKKLAVINKKDGLPIHDLLDKLKDKITLLILNES